MLSRQWFLFGVNWLRRLGLEKERAEGLIWRLLTRVHQIFFPVSLAPHTIPHRTIMWQYMAILELGGIRTCFYDAIEECPENIVDDYYYDCEDDDLHDEWKTDKDVDSERNIWAQRMLGSDSSSQDFRWSVPLTLSQFDSRCNIGSLFIYDNKPSSPQWKSQL